MIDKEILDEVLPVPELEELKEQKIEELQEEGFVVTNFHSGGIFYTLLMVVLRIRIECAELFRSILNNMFVSHASGTWLDLKLADYGKKRKKAQKARGYVTVKRSGEGDAIKIPKGHVFKTETDINGEELRFFVTENTVLQKGASSVDVIVEAEKEGSRYNVPPGQISKTLVYLGELDESFRGRGLRSWAELSQRAIEDSFINAAESVAGVLFAQADCAHPRGQGTVDVIVTGTAGEATEGLLKEVRAAVDKIAGPYDNILVKSSQNIEQDIAVTVTIGDAALTDEEVERRVEAILTELLAVRKGRKLNELNLSDINHAIREGLSSATNVKITTPGDDVLLTKDKVITLGAVTVTVKRRE